MRQKWLENLPKCDLPDDVIFQLLEAALMAYERAYAPYSSFKVGAAVLTDNGQIFVGCNIENSSFGATVCAERVAIFNAISAGHRSISALFVIADQDGPIAPCGMCRQVIVEFNKDAIVIMSNIRGDVKIGDIKSLLPEYFAFPISKEK